MGKIKINNMKFYTYNGALKEEQILGQNLEIDIVMSLSLEEAGKTDNLEKTVNYAEVYTLIKNHLQSHSYKLIEAVANGIMEELQNQYGEIIKHVLIRIRKYHVPINGIFDNIEIEMERDF